jgi:hypothetical protein
MATQSRSTGIKAQSHAHFDYNPNNDVVIATGQLEHIRKFIGLAGGTMHLEHAGTTATAGTSRSTSSTPTRRRRSRRSTTSTAGAGGGGAEAIGRKAPARAKRSNAPGMTRTAGAAGQ